MNQLQVLDCQYGWIKNKLNLLLVADVIFKQELILLLYMLFWILNKVCKPSLFHKFCYTVLSLLFSLLLINYHFTEKQKYEKMWW